MTVKVTRVIEEAALKNNPDIVFQAVEVQFPSWDGKLTETAYTIVLKGWVPYDDSLATMEYVAVQFIRELREQAFHSSEYSFGYHISAIQTHLEVNRRKQVINDTLDLTKVQELTRSLKEFQKLRNKTDVKSQAFHNV